MLPGETLGLRSTYISPRGANVLFAHKGCHLLPGALGVVSGTAAMSFRKGSPRHVLAGKVFVASMLTMAVVAVHLAIVRHQANNIGGGILTLYLIGTAWLTARRRDGENRRLRLIVLLVS